MKPTKSIRILIGVFCVLGLCCTFLFQHSAFLKIPGGGSDVRIFLLNKAFRYILNDFLMIGLIYSLFVKRTYVIFALYVQLLGIVLFLLPYFVLKLSFPSYNGPLVSYLHRLIVNPLLMLILLPAFFMQQRKTAP
jgi:exosortase F-associated protein